MQTILLLDVDGVLNVAVKDIGKGQLILDKNNLRAAAKLSSSADADHAKVAARMLAASARKLEGIGEREGCNYSNFVADDSTGLSDILVERFARLIQMAGANRKVVLSSSWRHPHQHIEAVKLLEQGISNHLGSPFVFDTVRPICKERTAQHRLDTIGLFLQTHSKEFGVPAAGQKVLVLDDLFSTSLADSDASCNSVASAEQHLRRWMPASDNVSVKFVHTFAEWKIRSGDCVKVGTGLTMEHFECASDFLAAGACTKKSSNCILPGSSDRAQDSVFQTSPSIYRARVRVSL